MCTHVCSGHACLCMHVWRPDINISVFLSCPLPYFLRQSFSLNLELNISARLAGQKPPGSCCLHPSNAGVTGMYHRGRVFCGCWSLDSGPHSYVASSLPLSSLCSPLAGFVPLPRKMSTKTQEIKIQRQHGRTLTLISNNPNMQKLCSLPVSQRWRRRSHALAVAGRK